MLSERVLARRWCLVAFMKALDLLYRAMRAVLYCRIATAIEMASKGEGHVAHRCVDRLNIEVNINKLISTLIYWIY